MESSLDLFAMSAALNAANEEKRFGEVGADQTIAEFQKIIKNHHFSETISQNDLIIEHEQDEKLSVEEFNAKYSKDSDSAKPVCIHGCTRSWRLSKLSIESLLSEFGNQDFALYNGQEFLLSDYYSYCLERGQLDANPLYLFEDLSSVSLSSPKSKLLAYYKVPKYFQQDLFEVNRISMQAREGKPRFRWFLIGPERSGTSLHIDPFATSAWNTLLTGRKLWVFLPPSTPSEYTMSDENLLYWFCFKRPRLKEDGLPILEYVQKSGETIFVPAGWWHAVINLSFTIAVTQNFVPLYNIRKALKLFGTQTDFTMGKRLYYSELCSKLRRMSADFLIPKSFKDGLVEKSASSNIKFKLWSPNDKEWLAKLEQLYNVKDFLGTISSRIPKSIHQIWLGNKSVPFTETFMQTWLILNPDWKFTLWRDSRIEELEMENKNAYLQASNYGEKSDIARYEILYHHGGIYIDVDFECIQNMEVITELDAGFICGFSNVGAVEINNGFIACIPRHPLLKQLINGITLKGKGAQMNGIENLVRSFLGPEERIKLLTGTENYMATIERTGPGYFTRTIMKYIESNDSPDILVLPTSVLYPAPNSSNNDARKYLRPETIAIHHWKKTWQYVE